ncbi:MAG: hypothetical protein F6K30_13310 [Cyanothece sp. SIO2G6]|nr:hypothetical protein [Cyanothece sp. SIO2G6]
MAGFDLTALFQQLLVYREQTNNWSQLGPWLQQHINTATLPPFEQLPLTPQTYTRHRIAQENPSDSSKTHSSFEALMVRWDQQVQTRIHGHPPFSFYHVITGVFEMELFTRTNKGLQFVKKRLFLPSDNTWCVGPVGQYDNFIHRVTCLEAGLTFHVYSDDAQKGVCFELATDEFTQPTPPQLKSCQKI